MELVLKDLERLPGAPDKNFEALTRAVVSRRYSGLGTLRERRNQPGVEFYLRVDHAGELGEPGRVWGWSCKWFILGPKNELTAGQRKQIEESVDLAVKHVDGLTDFVLCLPERPAKKDEKWIDGLGPAKSTTLKTKLWAAANFDAMLAGLDELRSTFFGELALTPDVLAKAHQRSVAPVGGRWVPLLHTANHVERRIDRSLLRAASFDWLAERADSIAVRIEALRDILGGLDGDFRDAVAELIEDLRRFVADLNAIVSTGQNLSPIEALQRITDQQPPATSPRKLKALVLGLRKRRLPAALEAAGLAAEIRDAVWWLEDAEADAQAPMIAIVAAAGQGKTHLAAQLTAPEGRPTAGVFIQGGHLRAGWTLDGLARRVPGIKVECFEDLLEALNSAGARAGARIPLVIDGLNEAQRSSEWRPLLDELVPALASYPNVLVIVTLREALAVHALPDEAVTVQLERSQAEVIDVVDAYFDHYLINPAGAWLPTGMFSNPLFVRMYCEAANPLRKDAVGVEALPTSLVGVFELYRDTVIQRLARDPARVPVPADQIRRRLGALALEMWTRGVRRLPSDDAKAILDAGETNWDESLYRRMEEEGVIFRDEADGSDDTETGVLFDRFAGYLIADALLARMAYAEAGENLADAAMWGSLRGEAAHPLGEDIAISLTGLLPRRFAGLHLWRHAPENHQSWALAQELDSESEFLDDTTVDQLATLIASWRQVDAGPLGYGRRHPFDRLWELRGTPAHRLNASFLDRVLRLLPLAERDRRWTEWVRRRAGDLLTDDVEQTIRRWTGTLDRADDDDLNALALTWLLTSTNRELRDFATKALQRYGRPEPKRLFDLATRMLDADDPYVVERVVGAAFGAASARQMPDPGGAFEHSLAGWLAELRNRFLREGLAPTSHELLRSYVRAVFELAGTLHPAAVPDGIDVSALTFASPPAAPVMADDDPNAEECDRTFGMDFENYVIGSVIDGRQNYDYDHPEFRRARGEVMARVWHLGWRASILGEVDRAIAEDGSRFGRGRGKTERYGKKYGWIAYYELVGRLADAGRDPGRWAGDGRNATPDIDPTFPDEPPATSDRLPEWVSASPEGDEAWLRSGAVNVPAELRAPNEIYGVTGGWLLAEGFLEHRRDGRQVFGFFRTLLLEADDAAAALELARTVEYPGNDFIPNLPEVRSVFAGETPWSSRFEVRYGEGSHRCPALRRHWNDQGIGFEQLAVQLPAGETGSPAALEHSYDVPSFGFASRMRLRQLPGTLDLVSLDGVRASATFKAEAPWRGHLLFLRRDLVVGYAGGRRIMQAAWGEREVTVDWNAVPPWLDAVRQANENIWRDIRLLDES
jgi:hypothetical protein